MFCLSYTAMDMSFLDGLKQPIENMNECL